VFALKYKLSHIGKSQQHFKCWKVHELGCEAFNLVVFLGPVIKQGVGYTLGILGQSSKF